MTSFPVPMLIISLPLLPTMVLLPSPTAIRSPFCPVAVAVACWGQGCAQGDLGVGVDLVIAVARDDDVLSAAAVDDAVAVAAIVLVISGAGISPYGRQRGCWRARSCPQKCLRSR